MAHGHKELEDGHVELEAAVESDSGEVIGLVMLPYVVVIIVLG